MATPQIQTGQNMIVNEDFINQMVRKIGGIHKLLFFVGVGLVMFGIFEMIMPTWTTDIFVWPILSGAGALVITLTLIHLYKKPYQPTIVSQIHPSHGLQNVPQGSPRVHNATMAR